MLDKIMTVVKENKVGIIKKALFFAAAGVLLVIGIKQTCVKEALEEEIEAEVVTDEPDTTEEATEVQNFE